MIDSFVMPYLFGLSLIAYLAFRLHRYDPDLFYDLGYFSVRAWPIIWKTALILFFLFIIFFGHLLS